MTEQAAVPEAAPKKKLGSVIRWVFLGAMMALLLFTVVMAAYRKFSG
jgi:hypothetical protein